MFQGRKLLKTLKKLVAPHLHHKESAIFSADATDRVLGPLALGSYSWNRWQTVDLIREGQKVTLPALQKTFVNIFSC